MSAISNWLWGTSQLDEAIDNATSELLPAGSEDIALNLEICDQIRSKSARAKDAMRALKRRLNHKNPNVQLLTLSLTDLCVKNGGDHFLVEIGSREFIDNLVSILKMPALNHEVKNIILRLIQTWSVAFEGKPSLGYVGQVYKTLQSEGFKFPPRDFTASNSVMVDTQTAPEWIDSDVCLRCRTAFTFTNRKHHCRNCGQVFDQQCSSKTMALPHFGITQEVRVCDGCYNKMNRRSERADKGHRHSASMHSTRHKHARDLTDADLQRAIQLSLQEVGAAGGHARPGYVPSQPTYQYSEPPIVDRTTYPRSESVTEEDDDPDLKAAIEASLREANAPKPSAPIVVETPRSEDGPNASYSGPGYSQSYPPGIVPPHPALPKIPNYDLEPIEADAIMTFSQTVEQVQAQGGRDMSRYPAVNELYDKASSLRPKLAMSLDDTGRKEQMLSDMHEKLSQAVKLYDQLLSEQVAHPRWRSQAPAAPYQQAPSTSYAQPVNGYAQWASSGPSQQVPAASEATPSQQPSYFPPQEAKTPTQESQPQWYAPQAAPVQDQPFTASSQTYQAQSPPPMQYSSPLSPSLPISSIAPVASLSRQNTISYSPSAATQHPVSSLARSNTIAHAPTAPAPFQQPYSQPQAQPQYAPQPVKQAQPPTASQASPFPQQYVASAPPPAPTPLPQFPVAPTTAPLAYSLYSPAMAVPTGIAQTEERKEALLIDL